MHIATRYASKITDSDLSSVNLESLPLLPTFSSYFPFFQESLYQHAPVDNYDHRLMLSFFREVFLQKWQLSCVDPFHLF